MAYFSIKKNDRLPPIQVTATYDDGTAVDITGATILFVMSDMDGAVKVNAAGAIVTAASGVMKYDWAAGDTDTVGEYRAEFKVTIGGKVLSVPNDEYCNVVVYKGAEDL